LRLAQFLLDAAKYSMETVSCFALVILLGSIKCIDETTWENIETRWKRWRQRQSHQEIMFKRFSLLIGSKITVSRKVESNIFIQTKRSLLWLLRWLLGPQIFHNRVFWTRLTRASRILFIASHFSCPRIARNCIRWRALFTKLIGFYLLADKRLVTAVVGKVVAKEEFKKNWALPRGGIARITETKLAAEECVGFVCAC